MENSVCHFVFYSGPRKGEAQVYNTARVSIGRASNCDFRLDAFHLDQVAQHHAELLIEEGAYYIYDLGTKSGTYVNGERVHDRCALVTEDYIQFGKEGPEVIFRTGEASHGKQPLPEIFPVTAELEFFSGSDAGRIFPINAAVISNIGRRADLEVPLDPRGDMIVSGNHCNIRYVNGHFVLTDTSRNGTYVNGDLVDQPMEILDGDVIMMGDGGPQARFHVDDAKRHYPNHRVLSPVAKSAATAAAAGGIVAAAADTVAPVTLASSKPFLSGAPPAVPPPVQHNEASAEPPPSEDTPLSEEAEIINEDVAEAEFPVGNVDGADAAKFTDNSDLDTPKETPTLQATTSEPADNDIDFLDDELDLAESPEAEAEAQTSIPSEQSADAFAAVPPPVKTLNGGGIKLSQNQKLIAIIGGAVILLIILVALFTDGGSDDNATQTRGNYAAALKTLDPVSNDTGAFKVQLPKGWTKLNRENFVSIESADKNVAIDYVRDGRANQAHLNDLLAKDGATVGQPKSVTIDGKSVQITRAGVGNVRRVGAIIPDAGAPVLAILETTQDALANLGEDGMQQLLVENVEITGAPAASVAAASTPVAPSPTPAPALPTPVVLDTTPAPAETPLANATAQPTSAPATSPSPAPTATSASADSNTTKTGQVITSKALGLTLTAPVGWTATSEEADEMLMFSDGKDLVVRIARDPGDLDAEATFKAMEDEGWKKEGVQSAPIYHAGEFTGKNQNLMLVLIPEKTKTTLLIYATSAKDFTPETRKGISDIMLQLLPTE